MSHDRECPLRTRHVTLRTSRLIRSSCVFLTFSFLSFHFISLVLSSYLPSNYKRHHAQKHTSFKQSSSTIGWGLHNVQCWRHVADIFVGSCYVCTRVSRQGYSTTFVQSIALRLMKTGKIAATTSQQGDQSHSGYLQLTNIIIFLFITRQKVRCLYC